MTDADNNDPANPTNGEQHDETVLELANLLMGRDAFEFGRFNLKSGRNSPYYISTERLCRGTDVFTIGRAFATTIGRHFGAEVSVICGPAFKGIPFTVMAAQYYGHLYNNKTEWAFTEGHAGPTIGAHLDEYSQVVVIDDVMTTGESLREAISVVKKSGARIMGGCVLIDRKERGKHNRLAVTDVERDTGVKIVSCATVVELLKHIPSAFLMDEQRDQILKHTD